MRQLRWVAGRVEACRQVSRPGNPQAVLLNGHDVFFPDVIDPYLCLARFRQMRGEKAANCTTPDDANPHSTSTPDLDTLGRLGGRVVRMCQQHHLRRGAMPGLLARKEFPRHIGKAFAF